MQVFSRQGAIADPARTRKNEDGSITYSLDRGYVNMLDAPSIDAMVRVRILPKKNTKVEMINNTVMWTDPSTGYASSVIVGSWMDISVRLYNRIKSCLSNDFSIELGSDSSGDKSTS